MIYTLELNLVEPVAQSSELLGCQGGVCNLLHFPLIFFVCSHHVRSATTE